MCPLKNPYEITISNQTAGTYTACFEESSEVVAHDIIIETANGTVEADKTSAPAGETVTLTVTPNPGYETVSVRYEEIDATMTEGKPTEYTFPMPNDDVYVIVKFAYAKPNGLTVETTYPEATISWEKNSQTNWKLQYSTDGSFTEGTYTEKDVNTTPSITLTGLDEDQLSYYVRVKAYNGTDESEWSDVVSFYPTDKLIIGSGTSTYSYLPTNIYENYSLTQQIYTTAELGEAGLIESIGFYNTSSATTRNLDIYMVSTDKTQFAGSSDGIPVTDDDLVFSGEVTFAENKWTTITLTQPFDYDGTKNVAIIVDDNTGTWRSSCYFRVFSTEACQAIYRYSDGTNYDPKNLSEDFSFSTTTQKNQIRILKSNKNAYAVLNGTTLTFYSDGNKPTTGTVYDLPWDENSGPEWAFDTSITTVEFDESFANFRLTSTENMFFCLSGLKEITGLEYLNTERVTDMSSMFEGCSSLKTLDVSNFNTEKVTDMSGMFADCSALETIYCAEDADWSKVPKADDMFNNCTYLSGKCGSEQFWLGYDGYTDGNCARVFDGTNIAYFTYKGNIPSYTLTVTDAGMATLYLDFPARIPKGVNAYICYLADLENDTPYATTHKMGALLSEYTGVFVKAEPGTYTFEYYYSAEPYTSVGYSAEFLRPNILTGTLMDWEVEPHSVLTLGYGKKTEELGFWWYTGTTIPANRAYIPGTALESTTGDVKGITIVFDDETRIEEIVNGKSSNGKSDEWYDLSGRKLEGKPTQKGIYINNGRKTLIK
ncbi:MAG: BspA family leucine-rich repeat surface protein [Bacteroidaceae bacterium]|nr:BspA family leucine-rich repeat surface protein [Bacteroidaceae bacterium]